MPGSGIETVRRLGDEILDASQHCTDRTQIASALTLIYSGIDQMGWLSRPRNKEDSDRRDFIRWVDNYMLPATGIDCDALDLYAARCGILHAQSAEARLTREGDATQIWYAWGNNLTENLIELHNFVRPKADAPHTIHLTELRCAFGDGVERFLTAAENNAELATLLNERRDKVLINVSQD